MTEPVFYSEPLIRRLQESLRAAFCQPFIEVTRASSRRSFSDIRITLTGGQANQRIVSAELDSPELIVMEILTEDGRHTNFWFGFTAVFQNVARQKHTLQHSNILVYQDIAGELVSLFRAEWDQLGISGTSSHAQPHWHFTQQPLHIERIVNNFSKSASGEIREFSFEKEKELLSGLPDCGMIHFAMTSLWEKSDTPSYLKRQFDSEEFPKWFMNLAQYIALQISYLISHVPRHSKEREFEPSELAK